MKFKALILISFVLACSTFAEENSQHEKVVRDEIKGGVPEPNHSETAGGGSGGGAGGYSVGFSHGGVYGGGQICKWGCCSKSFGYSHTGGGYYGCTCCSTAAEAKAYKDSQANAESRN